MRARLRSLLTDNAYRYSDELITLKSGLKSNHYVNCRPVLMHAEGGHLAAKLIRAIIHLSVRPIDVIAGSIYGVAPLVDSVISQEYAEDNFWFKAYIGLDDGKQLVEMDYGLLSRRYMHKIHADVRPTRAILLEDVWTTGNSAAQAVKALEEEDLQVVATVALVDREEPGTPKPTHSVFTLEELLPKHRKLGRDRRVIH